MSATIGLDHDPLGLDEVLARDGGMFARFTLGAVILATLVVAFGVGVVVPSVDPALVIAAVLGLLFIGAVALKPSFAAYTLLAVTPLIAGMNRGAVIPLLRPSEAVAFLAGVGLALRGLAAARRTDRLALPRLRTADVTILVMAITSSIIPLLWLLLRQQRPSADDFLYALTIWKWYGVYIIFRTSIRSVAQVRTCLYVAMVSAGLVAIIAIMQSLHLFGVTAILQRYFAPYGVTSEVANYRGGATLSLPVAVADLLVFALSAAFGLLIRGVKRREAQFLGAISVLYIFGILATGELSGLIALVVAGIALALLTHRGHYLVRMIPILLLALLFLQPVLHARLAAIDPSSGLPISWIGRLNNLRTFFWPHLFHGLNFVLGVRPSARVATPIYASGWVWIESGYTWLLWAGGIPFLLAYGYFTRENIRVSKRTARDRDDAVGAAALAVVVGLIVVAIGMTLDPHLTYRGSADLLFALLALASVGGPVLRSAPPAGDPRPDTATPNGPRTRRTSPRVLVPHGRDSA